MFRWAGDESRQIIIDGALWKIIDQASSINFIHVQLVSDPSVTRWFDIYMHRIHELDGPGVLEALADLGKEEPDETPPIQED